MALRTLLDWLGKPKAQKQTAKPKTVPRKWRFWKVEPAIACNIDCVMCPWKSVRATASNRGRMSEATFAALRPHLKNVQSIDFTGAGEGLLNPHILDWVAEAKAAGCEVGFLTNATLLDEERAQRIVVSGQDWLGVSLDGASPETFEAIRKGASFAKVTANIRHLAKIRTAGSPRIVVQMVMLKQNVHELEAMVELAADIGVDQITFKNCDVLRDTPLGDMPLFTEPDKQLKVYQKQLDKALRRAEKLGVHTKTYRFAPDEEPVCEHDPRSALFVRFDGTISPCVGLAYGGKTEFMGQPAFMPTIEYGSLTTADLESIWDTAPARIEMAEQFGNRLQVYNRTLQVASYERLDLIKLNRAFEQARKAMPPAPKGCDICHYLYDV